MGRKRTKAEPGDRITHTGTGEMGTIMTVYTPKDHPPNYSVLPDAGVKRNVLWKDAEAEWSERSTVRRCARCGEDDHWVVMCPFGDLGSHLTEAGRKALVDLGLDPRRTPGGCEDADAYDGIRLWTDASRVEFYAKMRRRVCTKGRTVIDGHDHIEGTCRHCGHKTRSKAQ